MNNQRQITVRRTATDRTLDKAIQRVYETYGSDLTRFFTGVRKEALKPETVKRREITINKYSI